VRSDNSLLVTSVKTHELWYVPPARPGEQVEPKLLFTFDTSPMSMVEPEPDVFYLARQGLRPGRHTSGVRESFVFARSEALPAKGRFLRSAVVKKGAVSGRAARSRSCGTGF